MSGDPQLVYSLEIKVLDLEAKVASLEKTLDRLAREVSASDPATVPADVLMTQKELGERSGIRANHISAIERGMPYGLKTAKRLSDALDVPVGLLT
jgi:DNA-binding XRE family transcriptional regulator